MTYLFVFLIVTLFFAYTAVSGAPWVPVRRFDIAKLVHDAKLKPGQTYLELGCGDGRLVRAVAKTGVEATGYELNPLLWLLAWLRCVDLPNAHIKFGDFWRVNLSGTDVVMAFLVPRTMLRLGRKAEAEMKPGAKLISYIFVIPGRKGSKHGSWHIYEF